MSESFIHGTLTRSHFPGSALNVVSCSGLSLTLLTRNSRELYLHQTHLDALLQTLHLMCHCRLFWWFPFGIFFFRFFGSTIFCCSCSWAKTWVEVITLFSSLLLDVVLDLEISLFWVIILQMTVLVLV